MKVRGLYILFALLGIALIYSCDTKTEYFQYDHTSTDAWEKNDTLNFDVDSIRQSGEYEATIGLRMIGVFPFKKLYLIVDQTIYPSREREVDTVCCRLTTEKGRPMGQGIAYYQYSFPAYAREYKQGDSVHVTIRHCMKRDILPGISDVGLRIERK